ncbi:hypothetical protein OSTOST_05814 [Ostertagia ostertagi]
MKAHNIFDKITGVIRLLDWYSIPEGYLIVMERPYPCVDMFDFIKGQQKLDEEMARFLFRQIAQTIQRDASQKRVLASGLEASTVPSAGAHNQLLHLLMPLLYKAYSSQNENNSMFTSEKRVYAISSAVCQSVTLTCKSCCFQDENVVIDLVTGDTKLIDFGAATVLKKSHYTDFQGTRLYCPPEWFLHSLYLGREAAVWSLGVLLYNALNGRLPFRNEKDICTAHLLGPLPFFTTVSSEAKDLIARCLAFDPFSRCSIEEILRHPWVTRPCADWLTLSAAAGDTMSEKEPKDDEREHSEELEEIGEEVENHDKHDDDDGRESSEGESGVGSSASTSTGKTVRTRSKLQVVRINGTNHLRHLFVFRKRLFLAPPNSDDLKAVVHASKTKSVYQEGPKPLRPSRRRRAQQPDSAVLNALRLAVSRDRQIRN